MSHAANLKSRQAHASLPSKRQRQSLESSTSSLKPNGVHIPFTNGTSKLVAAPVRDAKRRKRDLGQDEVQPAVVTGNDASVTAHQPEVVEISSGVEEEDDDSDSDDESNGEEEGSDGEGDSPGQSEDDADHGDEDERQDKSAPQINGIHSRRNTKQSTDDAETKSQQDEGDMSFGDLLVAKHGQDSINVDVTALDKKNNANALSTYKPARGQLTATNAASLGTVLTQALKTNDVELLESCLRVPNLDSIRATIERLHSSLAASLLSKLAERMHKRPGRAGSLMVWVQWTVVAHGGYLASQPQAMQQLRILYQVVKQRASGLQPLLALKGKLDMLEAQMQLRKRMQQRSREMHGDDVEPYIYVEGEESDDESRPKSLDAAGVEVSDNDDEEEEEEDDEDVSDDEEDEDEDDEEDEEDEGNLIDDEASEDSEAEEESDDMPDDVSDEGEHDSASDESEAQIETKRPRTRK